MCAGSSEFCPAGGAAPHTPPARRGQSGAAVGAEAARPQSPALGTPFPGCLSLMRRCPRGDGPSHKAPCLQHLALINTFQRPCSICKVKRVVQLYPSRWVCNTRVCSCPFSRPFPSNNRVLELRVGNCFKCPPERGEPQGLPRGHTAATLLTLPTHSQCDPGGCCVSWLIKTTRVCRPVCLQNKVSGVNGVV